MLTTKCFAADWYWLNNQSHSRKSERADNEYAIFVIFVPSVNLLLIIISRRRSCLWAWWALLPGQIPSETLLMNTKWNPICSLKADFFKVCPPVTWLCEWEQLHVNLTAPSHPLVLLHQTLFFFFFKLRMFCLLRSLGLTRSHCSRTHKEKKLSQRAPYYYLWLRFHWKQFPEFVCGSQGTTGVYRTLHTQHVFRWESPR